MGCLLKKNFHPGQFLLEYPAEIISEENASKREEEYKKEMKAVLYITSIARTVLRGKYIFKVSF